MSQGDIDFGLGRVGRVGKKQRQSGKSAYEAWVAASTRTATGGG
jgi:hypothetical protein